MNAFESCLLLVAIPAGLVALGYWLAVQLVKLSPTERLAVAMLAGLGVALWTVSVVNLVLPLAGVWGAVCLLPAALTLARGTVRRRLWADLAEVVFTRRGAVVGLAAVGLLALLLWPMLSRPDLVYYDGSGNHDAFFWIVGAELLKRQGYLQAPLADAVSPLYHGAAAITGWRPGFGRMGAEGLLALVSNLAGASPLKIYVVATAALLLPWAAAVFLTVRTFVTRRVTLVAAVTIVALQPMFVFFHANANLPNLLGVLAGALLLIATVRALGAGASRRVWLLLGALGVHALLCSYPEMVPVAGLPCGLLWLRARFVARGEPGWVWRSPQLPAAALAGLALNPVTAVRAWHGFFSSFGATTHPELWPNIFRPLAPGSWLPAMATLSVSFARQIGAAGGLLCAVLFAVAIGYAVWRARDRAGVLALLTGVGAMVAYTLKTNFGYGWQKTAQFSAVVLATLLPVGAVARLLEVRGRGRWLAGAMAAGIVGVFGAATVRSCREAHRWSERKYLTRDWFEARDYTRRTLRNAPVLVEAGPRQQPFFYTMWATYFLTDSRVYFPEGDPQAGGYLQAAVRSHPAGRVPSSWPGRTGWGPTGRARGHGRASRW
ncbi:MAG: hypothetical protein NTV51_23130 [Verrucomicrobia bacterium]|nr:hypothetical protein [Verrucomicrobiota bacterium]